MDKFVIRAPTWKTMSYAPVAATTGFGRSSLGGSKKAPSKLKPQDPTKKRTPKPLQDKQFCTNTNQADNGDAVSVSQTLSIRDERLLKLFTTKADQPLLAETATASDSGCSSSSDSFHGSAGFGRLLASDENVAPHTPATGRRHLNFNDPLLDNSQLATSQPTSTSSHLSSTGLQQPFVVLNDDENATLLEQQRPSTPQNAMLAMDSPTLPSTPKENPLIMRIQRDLNSPSASVRVRALKALRSPTKSAYAQFDVPHAEQSIITAEERRTPEPPKTIQELMQDIIVYVEVRTGEDNRSAGVKKVISALGAKVNDKLLRDTTHVIFKDGLLSTYKKAKNWDIPVVSILWIEACKNQRTICDPSLFPISNVDRYENPELYDKLKRHKSMQPDSEANKRVRVKGAGTPKDSTPKTGGALKKTSTLIGGTPSSTSNNKKTDISRFFKQLGSNSTTTTPQRLFWDPRDIPVTPANSLATVAASPATTLLNKINADCFDTIDSSNNIVTFGGNIADETPVLNDVKKSLNFVPGKHRKMPSPTKRALNRRRNTFTATIEETTNSIAEMQLSQTPRKKHASGSKTTPSRTTRRRSSIHVATSMNITKENTIRSSASATKATVKSAFAAITEEEIKVNEQHSAVDSTPSKRVTRRQTTFTAKALEFSDFNSDIKLLDAQQTAIVIGQQTTTAIGRRTLFTPQQIEQSISDNALEKTSYRNDLSATKCAISTTPTSKRSVRRQTLFSARTLEITEEVNEAVNFPEQQIAVVSSIKTKGRRTLFTPQTIEQSISTNVLESTTAAKSKDLPPTAIKRRTHFSDTQLHVNQCTITPFSSNVASSTRLQNETLQTPPQQIGSLIEETAATAVFSSTRLPGRRRTLFDVSMDIISQRLQNINKSARRSMAPPNANDLEVRRNSLEQETPTLKEKPKPIESISTPILPSQSVRKELFHSSAIEITTSNIDQSKKHTTMEDNTTPVPKKKRKLFVPNSSLLLMQTPPTTAQSAVDLALVIGAASPLVPSAKRRRTLMPLAQPLQAVTKGANATSTSTVAVAKIAHAPRRSTMDFESAQKAKTSFAAAGSKKGCGTFAAAKPSKTSAASNEVAVNNTGDTAKAVIKQKPQTPRPFLVYTNMHTEQIAVIKEAVAKLGHFQLEGNVSDVTTHIVSLEPRRTLNLLRALLRGLWILEFTWIEESLRAGKWLSEEQYELRDFSRAVEICRSERQAFGKSYKSELFSSLGAFYISSRCGPVCREDLVDLVQLCGGKVVEQRKRAKYILGDTNKALDDKVFITPYWILDSITQMQLQKFSRYTSQNNAKRLVTAPTSPLSARQTTKLIPKPPLNSETYSQI